MERIPRPAKELRDQAARDKILQAASTCVVRSGFHGASMADIAKVASMSVGQIYRYFPSKEAIIHGIVERIVENRLKWIDSHDEPRARIPSRIAQHFVLGAESESRDERVLMLEVVAEATRSPQVAQALREADDRLRAKGLEIIRRNYPKLSEQQTRGVIELFAVLAEGTAVRRVTGLRGDEDTLVSTYTEVIRRMLPSKTQGG